MWSLSTLWSFLFFGLIFGVLECKGDRFNNSNATIRTHLRDNGKALNQEEVEHLLKWTTLQVKLVGFAGTKAFFRDKDNIHVDFGRYIEFCNNQDMNPAAVETEEETKAIEHHYKVVVPKWFQGMWLGTWDPNREDKWIWINNMKEMTYKNWFPNEPSANLADCAEVYTDGSWYGQSCTSLRPPMCQLDLTGVIEPKPITETPPETTTTPPPSGWLG